MSWKEDPPTIIEHNTVQPVVERNTIIERDNWYSEPWAIALVIGAIAIVALVAYWALYNPNQPTYVSNTTIERPVPDGRAQTITPPPTVNVTPPPTVNVTPPPATSTPSQQPPVIINNTPPNTNTAPETGTGSSNNGGTDAGTTAGTSAASAGGSGQ